MYNTGYHTEKHIHADNIAEEEREDRPVPFIFTQLFNIDIRPNALHAALLQCNTDGKAPIPQDLEDDV